MHLFLTGVLPFLAHDHPSAAAYLTCRYHNFHASIIPEFLSDEKRVKLFYEARQQKQIKADKEKQYANLYNLFIQTPLMQFSPSLLLCQEDCAESILKPLLATKYFTRSLQRCTVLLDRTQSLSTDVLQGLSRVQSLIKLDLDLDSSVKESKHLEIIINCFPSLETLTIDSVGDLQIDDETLIKFTSSASPATKTLRILRLERVDNLLVTGFVPHFANLRKLVLEAKLMFRDLDLQPMSSSLPLLTDLTLNNFTLENTEPLNNLVSLSSLEFTRCRMKNLNFLSHENSLPHLCTLCVWHCDGLVTSSFESVSHAPNLCFLELAYCEKFNNNCLQYLENMVHLRRLNLCQSNITGDSRLLKTLMQNLFQLEELNLSECDIGGQGAIAGALYSTHSKLRVLRLWDCYLVDDDLDGISALKNTLESLSVAGNFQLTSKGLRHCRDLVKLNDLNLRGCNSIEDLSPLKDCLELDDLDVSGCEGLTDDSFKVFGREPNSFPKLRVLELPYCEKLKGKLFKHLSKNNNLVHQLKQLDVRGMFEKLASSPTARNNLCLLQGLRRLRAIGSPIVDPQERTKLRTKLIRNLKNLDEID